MLLDRFRKKIKRPIGGGNSPLETVDITDQVPDTDDVLDEVNNALKKAARLENQFGSRGHWESCCGGRRWVND